MMMEIYMMTLLTLCLVALVLALVLLMQGAISQQSQPIHDLRRHDDAFSFAFDQAPTNNFQNSFERSHTPAAPRAATRVAKAPLLISGPKPLLETEQLSIVISAFARIRQNGNNASFLLAERTLPRLKDNSARVSERLHMGRHRLQLVELGDDLTSAVIARQTLRQLPRFETHA